MLSVQPSERKQIHQKKCEGILEWLKSKAVERGHPEQLKEAYEKNQLRRIVNDKEAGLARQGGFALRRLHKKLAISA